MEMATVTSVNPLKVRLWGAETDSLVWRISSAVTPRLQLDVLVTTIHHGLVVIADASTPPA